MLLFCEMPYARVDPVSGEFIELSNAEAKAYTISKVKVCHRCIQWIICAQDIGKMYHWIFLMCLPGEKYKDLVFFRRTIKWVSSPKEICEAHMMCDWIRGNRTNFSVRVKVEILILIPLIGCTECLNHKPLNCKDPSSKAGPWFVCNQFRSIVWSFRPKVNAFLLFKPQIKFNWTHYNLWRPCESIDPQHAYLRLNTSFPTSFYQNASDFKFWFWRWFIQFFIHSKIVFTM